jgi:hypothetical protein
MPGVILTEGYDAIPEFQDLVAGSALLDFLVALGIVAFALVAVWARRRHPPTPIWGASLVLAALSLVSLVSSRWLWRSEIDPFVMADRAGERSVDEVITWAHRTTLFGGIGLTTIVIAIGVLLLGLGLSRYGRAHLRSRQAGLVAKRPGSPPSP